MKKLFYILILFTLNAQAQLHKMLADTDFFYTYGGTNFDETRDIKETLDKNYIMVGTTSSFGQGDASVYMIKTDALGKHIWSSVQGGAVNDWAYAVEITPDSGFFVAGYSNSFNASGHNYFSPYYFKTDKNGVLVWQKSIDVGSWSFIYSSCALPDSGFILCGQTYYATPNGSSDAYLMRINKNGDTLWTNHYGGIQDETFNSVCVINSKIYAAGSNATHPTDTVADGWVVKLDLQGHKLQEAFLSYGYHQQEVINGISIYNDTMFSVCGNQIHIDTNVTTGIAARYDTSLIVIQDITHLSSLYTLYNNPAVTLYSKVVTISDGSTCIIGSKVGAGLGGYGMFCVGFSSLGYNIDGFYPTIGGHLDDYGYSVIYTSQGRVIAVGSTQSTADYCANPTLGLEDVFLVRYNSDSIHTQGVVPIYSCYLDTLFLWQTNIKNYTKEGTITLFPNPVCGNATLNIQGNYSNNLIVKVYSLLGEAVLTLNVNSNEKNNINFSFLSEGSYFLKVQDVYGNNISVIKFMVAY